jgi:hypothetical protein
VGDFMLAFDANTGDGEDGPVAMARRWVGGLAIERKCLDDIVCRSAERGEGPHFRQERQLRFSGIKYPCFLIEGDLSNTDKIRPNVGQGRELESLERLDVIQSREELLGYMCGITCRNFGRHRVSVLHTTTSMETAIMLAALSVVMADEYEGIERAKLKEVSMATLHKHWHGIARNKRGASLVEKLTANNLATGDAIHRIQRRFGDEAGLCAAYDNCSGDVQGELLLKDLSLCASNMCDEAEARDSGPAGVTAGERIHCSQNIFCALRRAHSASVVSSYSAKRCVVRMSASMAKTLDNLKGCGSYVHATVDPDPLWCADADFQSWLPWSKVTVEESWTGGSRRSGALFFVCVPGTVVVETLAAAFDALDAATIKSRLGGRDSRVFELSMVMAAWASIRQRFSPALQGAIAAEEALGYCPQVVILLDNLGRGSGKIGACGRLKTVHAQASSEPTLESSWEEQEGAAAAPCVYLGKATGPSISLSAATFITSQLSWVVNLFLTVAPLKLGYQIFHTNTATPVIEVVATFICVFYKQALLPYAVV